MKDLPDSNNALVLRTDFSDEAAWVRVCREIEAPTGEFRAYVSLVSDPAFDGVSTAALISLAQHGPYRSFMFIVDGVSLKDPEHPILVLDLVGEPGRTFRVIPREMSFAYLAGATFVLQKIYGLSPREYPLNQVPSVIAR